MQNSLVIELDEGDALLNARMDIASVLQPLYDQPLGTATFKAVEVAAAAEIVVVVAIPRV